MIAMTMNSVLRGIERPVTLVPVYLGYDHVMEVATYHKELSGKKKKKNLCGRCLVRFANLVISAKGYVNFGEPITLQNFLNERAPNWRTELADDPEQNQAG